MAHGVHVGSFFSDDAPLFGECFADFHARFEAVHAVELGAGATNVALGVHDGGHVEVVAHTEGVVVGVVGGGDLHGAGAELGVDVVISDNDHLAFRKERVVEGGADQICVAFVIGVNSHRDVTKHCFHTRGCDDDMWFVVVEGAVADGD